MNTELEKDPAHLLNETYVEIDRKVAEDAPYALQELRKRGAMDLAEMLGLTPYLKEDEDEC